MEHSETDHDTLIKEACSDSAAFAKLYRMHYEDVFRYCCRRLFNRESAEDVTSTVFFRVMEKIHLFEGDSRDFRNWVYTISNNAVNDYLRAMKKRGETIRIAALERSGDLVSGSGTDNEIEEASDMGFKVKRAVLRLKPKYQAVITLRFFEKMKLTEIAEVLGKNPATIRSQLSRALSKLRKALEAEGS